MKKLLGIVVLGLLMSGNAYADDKKYKLSDKIIKDYFKNMTVADIIEMAPSDSLQEITTNSYGVQYHFFIPMKQTSKRVPVICFINSKISNCRVP
ncbi:hypothetical protein N9387_00330 [Candidatus Pelagibacter sp.]|nr:hypothetical protein [Candidatus Pelagibacter sp.]